MNSQLLSDDQIKELNMEFGLKAATDIQSADEQLVQEDRQCPLCPGHKDYDFVWNKLLNAEVCVSCSYDIHFDLFMQDERPPVSEGYDYADTIMGRLEQLSGQTFQQLKFRHLTNQIEEWSCAIPDYIKGSEFLHMPDSELSILNKRLDFEMQKIYESKERIYNPEIDKTFTNLVFESISENIKEKHS
jgi:hypothetical protein